MKTGETDGRPSSACSSFAHWLMRAGSSRPARLEQAVRDVTWQPRVRQLALRALLHHSGSGEDGVPTLRALLDDIRDGRVEDRDGELAGTLLSALYPDHVGPAEVWDYLLPLPSSVAGTHYRFWSAHLRKRTSGSDTIALIQAFLAKGKEFRQYFAHHWLADKVLDLLAKALAASDEDTPVVTLYDWLELMTSEGFGSARMRRAGNSEVRRWLAERPDLQKQLALEGLRRQLRPHDRECGARTCTAR